MVDVFAQHSLEVAARDDQDPVEALAPNAADPALGVRLRFSGGDRRADDADPLRAKEGVKGLCQFDVAIADHDVRMLPVMVQISDDFPCVPCHPGAVGEWRPARGV
jgi:hypothetical protein